MKTLSEQVKEYTENGWVVGANTKKIDGKYIVIITATTYKKSTILYSGFARITRAQATGVAKKWRLFARQIERQLRNKAA